MSIEQAAVTSPARVREPMRDSARASLGAGPLELVIANVADLTPRIRRFELRAPAGGALPPWTPGAHIAVPVLGASGADTRSYSLMGDCDVRDVYEIAVRRDDDGRGGSRSVHHDFRLGLRLRCGMPANTFELTTGSGPVLLIAGGIGITPIRAMAISLVKRNTDFALHYATRSPAETALAVDLVRRFEDRVRFWHSTSGYRLHLPSLISAWPRHGQVYVCGPAPMIEAVLTAGESLDFPSQSIHFERFVAAVPTSSDHAFDVHLARSGRTVHVPSDTSVLDALLAAGVPAEYGCQAGVCGSCAVGVLEGEVDHRDTVLSDEQRTFERRACICVSRAKGARLVIDL